METQRIESIEIYITNELVPLYTTIGRRQALVIDVPADKLKMSCVCFNRGFNDLKSFRHEVEAWTPHGVVKFISSEVFYVKSSSSDDFRRRRLWFETLIFWPETTTLPIDTKRDISVGYGLSRLQTVADSFVTYRNVYRPQLSMFDLQPTATEETLGKFPGKYSHEKHWKKLASKYITSWGNKSWP
jgi:hypothetical protein